MSRIDDNHSLPAKPTPPNGQNDNNGQCNTYNDRNLQWLTYEYAAGYVSHLGNLTVPMPSDSPKTPHNTRINKTNK